MVRLQEDLHWADHAEEKATSGFQPRSDRLTKWKGEYRYKKKQWQQTKKGEFWQLDNKKSFEAISSEFFAKDEEEEQYFCKRFFTCQPISRVPWNDDGLYDDQHQNRGENTDEREVFMTVTELKLITGIDQ